MKNIILLITLCISISASSQVTKITVQASGLTCSMCSNSINKALKTLPFVAGVTPDIKTSSFDITIKPGTKPSFDDVRRKVEGAGFSVASMKADINFSNQKLVNDEHVSSNGMTMHFINVKDQTLNGIKTVQILDKGFVSAKTFKKNEVYTKMDCYRTGVAGSCCSKDGIAAGTRIYHVTI